VARISTRRCGRTSAAAFSVVQGARPETTALLEQQWDHIFFTGGTAVGGVGNSGMGK
jgi:hypothetical protein